ncbi:Molybdenum cofactor guanylyltransferase [Sphingomonas aurantiaca]|uniref:Molybdenum cofactor guanylyltransferase n=1 Tax=Sphingomonas aurantiaca TaxID=185949 RepID=A0A5E8A240_9SPHN|nr:NTP transferase domain-containing protein [Sphingomonas aurantiaca]VVT25079.1 Molybdenum cofactor guanylyltransferase [Sphingomonas aurantiaca]
MLAGGQSSRFGSDKAQAVLDGRALAEHARALLATHVERAVIAGRDGAIPDRPGPGLGPLGGIAGALDHAAGLGFTSVLTIACDMPRLPDGLLSALARRASAYCPDAPVLGHWETRLLGHLLAHIETVPRRSVRGWAEAIGAIPIPAGTRIPNVNTPQDLDIL